jgi:hypothetical protein
MEIGLYYLCAISGLVLVLGSLILIGKGRIYIDAETKKVTHIELPFGIRLTSNAPVLIMFLFGSFLLAFPIYQIKDIQKNAIVQQECKSKRIYLTGKFEWPEPLQVYVYAADPHNSVASEEISVEVPLMQCRYIVAYWARDRTSLVGQEIVTLDGTEDKAKLNGPKTKFVPPPSQTGEAGTTDDVRNKPGATPNVSTR